jgi:hypothetical protein
MVPRHADALRSMKAIYIDAGTRDEWYLDLRAEAFRRALEEIGVRDVFLELFDATRGGIEYRYPIGLKYLAERLSPPGSCQVGCHYFVAACPRQAAPAARTAARRSGTRPALPR